MKQKKLIFNFFINRNWKKLTDSRKIAKILADNRKSHHPIENLIKQKAAFEENGRPQKYCFRNMTALAEILSERIATIFF